MDVDIFLKGKRLLEEEHVALADETERALYFEVQGDTGVHRVRLMRDHTFNCTCTWGTLKGAPYGSLCSHVVAVLYFIGERAAPVNAA